MLPILVKSHYAGIGSVFNSTLLCIEKIINENPGTYPVVLWDLKPYGEGNLFYKFFDIIGFNTDDTNIDQNFINTFTCMGFNNDNIDTRCKLHNIYTNHIKPKQIITDYVNNLFENITYDHLFGIHFRNTDRILVPQFASPGVDIVSKRMLDVLNKYNNKKVAIYIASDNIPDVDYFKEFIKNNYSNYNNIIFVEDKNAARSINTKDSVHGMDDNSNVDYYSPEQKILSILCDIYSLAKCELMVRTCSNVTCSSGIINKDSLILDVSLENNKFTESWLSYNKNYID